MTFRTVQWLALLLPAGLLAGAYGSQYIGGLFPCEMCWWQRYPHFLAVALALLSFAFGNPFEKRILVALAGFAILTSGIVAANHAGIEYGWWTGMTKCTSTITGTGGDLLKSILNAPLTRCDRPAWTWMGISLAGYNFLLSCGGAIAILAGIWKTSKPPQSL
jgi:disulfide bond formation protein DsbB